MTTWARVSGRKGIAGLKAARIQHHVAVTFRAHLLESGKRQYDIAAELGEGWGEGKISRLVSGAATMSLTDLLTLIDLCGLTFVQFASSLAGDDLPVRAQNAIIIRYLQEQLQTLEAGTVRSEPAHPSTDVQPSPGDPA